MITVSVKFYVTKPNHLIPDRNKLPLNSEKAVSAVGVGGELERRRGWTERVGDDVPHKMPKLIYNN